MTRRSPVALWAVEDGRGRILKSDADKQWCEDQAADFRRYRSAHHFLFGKLVPPFRVIPLYRAAPLNPGEP